MSGLRILGSTLLFLLAPVTLFIFGRLFPVTQSTKILFQPPSWVFGVVWSIISILLGFISAKLLWDSSNYVYLTLYFTILLLWCAWIIANHKRKKAMTLLFLILSGLFVVGYVMYLSYFKYIIFSVLLLVISVSWLLFASSMNGVDLQYVLENK